MGKEYERNIKERDYCYYTSPRGKREKTRPNYEAIHEKLSRIYGAMCRESVTAENTVFFNAIYTALALAKLKVEKEKRYRDR